MRPAIRRDLRARCRLACVAVLALGTVATQAQLHKCVANGSVTYQNTPCPATQPRNPPSVDQLNAERRKRLAEAAGSAGMASTPDSRTARPALPPADLVRPATRPSAAAEAVFRCDGRQSCAQMTSCAEATYFLKHCPTVKMDGDGDGVPCEQQWCFR